jgi:hypothetical protein
MRIELMKYKLHFRVLCYILEHGGVYLCKNYVGKVNALLGVTETHKTLFFIYLFFLTFFALRIEMDQQRLRF